MAGVLHPWVATIGFAGSMLFSTLSYAIRNMSRVKLEEKLAARGTLDQLDRIMEARQDLALSSSALRLIFSSVVIISVAYYFQDSYADHPIRTYALVVALTVPTLLIITVAIPQAWARYAGEGLIAWNWWLLRPVNSILYPVVAVMKLFDEIVKRLAGVTIADDPDTEAEQVQQDLIAAVSEGQAEGVVDEEQKKMIESVITFGDMQAAQVMTPRTDIVAVDVTTPISEVRDKIIREGLSRLPLFENTLDNIVGVLYAKDLLHFLNTSNTPAEKIDLRKLMRPPMFVPATKPLRDLLREIKMQQVHLAIVLDEYGGTAGLVTTEDIVEEIVGDIADEYERPKPAELKRIDARTVELDARIAISEVNRELGIEIPESQEYNTLAGFVIASIGAIPVKGETVAHNGATLTVLDSEPRRIKRIKIDLPEKESAVETAPGK
jgi:CBS domain containing-hemolysin-like protein